MEQLKTKLQLIGKEIPAGLRHVLLHHCQSRKEVYKYMYGQLVYGGKKAPPGSTLIYPEEIRQVVRERFPEDGSGAYVYVQYTDPSAGTYLSLEEMAVFEWRNPPGTYSPCRSKAQAHYKPR